MKLEILTAFTDKEKDTIKCFIKHYFRTTNFAYVQSQISKRLKLNNGVAVSEVLKGLGEEMITELGKYPSGKKTIVAKNSTRWDL